MNVHSFTLDHLGFNWFDVALLAIIVVGYFRGRKNGMTKEMLLVSKWVVLVAACTLGYRLIGNLLIQSGVIKSVFGRAFNESTAAYVTAYLFIAVFVFILFSFVKKMFKEKMAGSNVFGSGEYYLGMISGIIRYACMTIVFLAVLNAPIYSAAEIQARKEYNNRWFGGGLEGYSGNFIPSVSDIQDSVFKDSFLGPQIKNNLSLLLINSNGGGKKSVAAHSTGSIHIGN